MERYIVAGSPIYRGGDCEGVGSLQGDQYPVEFIEVANQVQGIVDDRADDALWIANIVVQFSIRLQSFTTIL